jgi:prophage antirepressor-like protein
MAALSPRPDSAPHPFSRPPQGFVNVTPRLDAANAHWATYYVHCATFRFFDWAAKHSGCPWNDLYYHDGLAIWAHPLVAEHLDIWMRTGQRVPPPRSNSPSPTSQKEPAMNVIVPFTFEASEVRVIPRDGEPWFVAADIARVLEIGRTDDAVRRLDDDEKGTDIIRTPGGDQEMTIINESGLYSLILTSRKPAAKRFKKWVTAEVIPSIRKTGGYGVQRDPMEVLSDPTAMRGLLLTYSEKVLALQPKADAFDRIANADGNLCPTDAAKALQIQPKKLSDWLQAQKWAYRRLGKAGLVAYQDKIQAGLLVHKVYPQPMADGETKVRERLMITAKGMTKLAEAFGGPTSGLALAI